MAKYWDDNILAELVQSLKDGDLYLFAGAGLSYLAGYPLWKDLLQQFADAYLTLPNLEPQIASELPQLVRSYSLDVIDHLFELGRDGQAEYVRILQKFFVNNSDFDIAHKYLLDLPFAGYITTNYDLCFESAASAHNLKVEIMDKNWFCYPPNKFDYLANNIQELMHKKPSLLHMHGCIQKNGRVDCDNIILRESQYGDYYYTNEMSRICDFCFYEKMLMVGTSLGDSHFMNHFKSKRNPGSCSNLANRQLCYVVKHDSERSDSPSSDERMRGIKYCHFTDWTSGLRNMIEELHSAYKSGSGSVINP